MEDKEKQALQPEESSNSIENTEEVLDETVDTPEVESDEHEETDEYAAEHKELPDYELMSVAALCKEAERLLNTQEPQHIKEEMEGIHAAALKALDEVRNEKLQAFIEEGGNEIDFQYDQPERKNIQQLYRDYKQKRRAYYQKLEAQLMLNLDVKKTIIEELKQLPNTTDSVPNKYSRFRELQDRWHATGPVPRTESNELWNNYHHHIDNFYDFLRISNQLRELDLKKNLEAKTALCEEAEALSNHEANHETFKVLQQLHAKWKRIGPVDREQSEPIWERFSNATKAIHDKRHEFYTALRAQREDLLEQKRNIIAQIEALNVEALSTHGAWQTAMRKIEEYREAFKAIGRIGLPGNDIVWEAFREANRKFNRAKNQFYKSLKAQHQENLERKNALLARAQSLMESTDWKGTANELKQIQAEWKKIGYVPKAESDRIWKEFRAACNHFFDRLTAQNKEKDKAFAGNLAAKEALLEKVKSWVPTNEKGEGISELKEMIAAWKEIGRVPQDKREIENTFNKLLDAHFKTLKLNKREASMIHFENKVQHIMEGDNAREIGRFKDELKRKIEDAQKELSQLENNMMFFAHADEKNPIVKEAKRNVERARENVELLKHKLKTFKKTESMSNQATDENTETA